MTPMTSKTSSHLVQDEADERGPYDGDVHQGSEGPVDWCHCIDGGSGRRRALLLPDEDVIEQGDGHCWGAVRHRRRRCMLRSRDPIGPWNAGVLSIHRLTARCGSWNGLLMIRFALCLGWWQRVVTKGQAHGWGQA